MRRQVERSTYPGWNNYPVYKCRYSDEHNEVYDWMRANGCEHFLLSSGGSGYVFQVKTNHEWFILRWS